MTIPNTRVPPINPKAQRRSEMEAQETSGDTAGLLTATPLDMFPYPQNPEERA